MFGKHAWTGALASLAISTNIAAQGVATPISAPPTKADSVDWTTGWQATEGYTGNFARAQSLMSTLARIAYWSDGDVLPVLDQNGFVRTNVVHDASLDGFAGSSSSGSMNFISIRGTQQFVDVLTDAFNVPTLRDDASGKHITLHQGFAIIGHRAVEALRDSVRSSCPQGDGQPLTPLWLTGHSLGGPAAAIAAYELANQGCNVAGVTVFGSPRPGLRDFQEAYASTQVDGVSLMQRTQRWVFGKDPVYCTPPGGAWAHVGIENRIDDGIELATQTAESQCTSPEDWIGKLQRALQIGSLETADLPAALTGAVADFLNGLIRLTFQCSSNTRWDELWSLGGCAVTDTTNRLIQTYNVSPTELVGALIRVAYAQNHVPQNYADALAGVDWSDPTEWVNLRVTLDVPGFESGQVMFGEELTGQVCSALPDPQGRLACDFQVPVGYEIRLRIAGEGTHDLYAVGCTQHIDEEGVDANAWCATVVSGAFEVVYELPPILL